MTVELQTGNQVDVTSASDAELYAAMFGDGNVVLRTPLELKMEDANTLSVGPGNASQNGRHLRFKGSTEFIIPSGTQAQKRSHLAVVRTTITRDDETMQTIEHSEPLVLSGEPTMDGTPEDPPIIEGNLLEGDTIADFPLARVVTDGINALDPVPLFETLPSYMEFRDSQSLKRFRILYNSGERLISGINGSTVQGAGAEGTNVYDISDLGFEKPPIPLVIPVVGQNVLFKATGGLSSLRTDQVSISWHCLTPSYVTPSIVLFEPA